MAIEYNPGDHATAEPGGRSPGWLRWLAIPIALLIAAILLFATGAMSRDQAIQSNDTLEAAKQAGEARSESGGAIGPGIAQLDRNTVVFETENGTYAISSDGNTLAGPGEGGNTYVQTLRPDPDGEPLGFRVNPDGTFDVVRLDELGPDDLAIFPNGNGFTILGESKDLTVAVTDRGTFVYDGDGNVISELPNQNSDPSDLTFSQLPDGVFERAPEFDDDAAPDSGSTESASSPSTSSDSGGLNLWGILGILAAVLAAIAAGLWFVRRQADQDEPQESDLEATAPVRTRHSFDGESDWDRFERFLAELRSDPDERRAIERAYQYVEGGIGPLPGRALTMTPIEYQESARRVDGQLAAHLRTITDAIVRLEYGFTAPTPSERDLVVDDLESLVRKAVSSPASSPGELGGRVG